MFTKRAMICQSTLLLATSSPYTDVAQSWSLTGISSLNIVLEENSFNTFKLTSSLLSKSIDSTLSSSVQSVHTLTLLAAPILTLPHCLAPSPLESIDFAPRHQIREPSPLPRFRQSPLNQTCRYGYGYSSALFLPPNDKLWITSLCSSRSHRS